MQALAVYTLHTVLVLLLECYRGGAQPLVALQQQQQQQQLEVAAVLL
jgi:hypothetical protein